MQAGDFCPVCGWDLEDVDIENDVDGAYKECPVCDSKTALQDLGFDMTGTDSSIAWGRYFEEVTRNRELRRQVEMLRQQLLAERVAHAATHALHKGEA